MARSSASGTARGTNKSRRRETGTIDREVGLTVGGDASNEDNTQGMGVIGRKKDETDLESMEMAVAPKVAAFAKLNCWT